MNKFSTKNIALAGMFIAMGIVLPYLTVNNPSLGNMFLPMHLPVLLSGFVIGWPLAFIVGFATPIIRSLAIGMPPFIPTALSMAFELATFGAVAAIIYRALPGKPISIYISLICSMIAGRIVSALVNLLLLGFGLRESYSFQIFLAGAFLKAWPGIILQIILIPALVIALEKANLISKE